MKKVLRRGPRVPHTMMSRMKPAVVFGIAAVLSAGWAVPTVALGASAKAFPWLSGKWIDVGLAPCLALRVNYVGELGWELHHPIEYQNHVFDALMEAGRDLGLAPFGIRAMDSMRFEKSYRMVGTELSIEYAALESELNRFVHPNKGDFIGRDAL